MRSLLLVSLVAGLGCASFKPGTDVAPDAGADVPTTPTIEISPAEPTSADELSAVIVTPSTDPAGGTVVYTYQWRRDGDVVDELTGDSVASTHTEKGQTWQLIVTPRVDDREGESASAMVVIANAPPVLTTAGLSRYQVVPSDGLGVEPGPIIDADGDAATLDYNWSLNGNPVSQQFNGDDDLDMSAVGVSPGDEISVEVTVRDADGPGNIIELGPVEVVDESPRWRQLLPTRVFSSFAAPAAFDLRHRRILVLDGISLWELPFEGRRFRQLYPTGTHLPTIIPVAIFDPINERAILFGLASVEGELQTAISEIDVSSRGGERWNDLQPGMVPSPRAFAALVFDEEAEQIYMIGGATLGDDSEFTSEFWSFDISDGQFVGELRTDVVVPTGFVSPGVARHPTERRIYFFGGGGSTDAPGTEIWSLSLEDDPPTFTRVDADMPASVFGQFTLVDPEQNRIVLAGGAEVIPGGGTEPYTNVLVFDLDTESLSAQGIVGDAESLGGLGGIAAWDDINEEFHIVPGNPDPSVEQPLEILSFNPDTDTLSSFLANPYSLPPNLYEASAGPRDSDTPIVIFGGADGEGEIDADVWLYHADIDRWTIDMTDADPVSGNRPTPVRGVVTESSASDGLTILRGATADTTEVNPIPFRLESGDWTEFDGDAAQPPETQGRGLSVWGNHCGQTYTTYFGGADFSNQVQTAGVSGYLSCPGPNMTSCSWSDIPDPPELAWAGAAHVDHVGTAGVDLVVFGGKDPTGGATAGLWTYDQCVGGGGWVVAALTAAGGSDPAPSARYGHSLTNISDTEFLLFAGGTSDDGGGNRDVFRFRRLGDDSYEFEEIVIDDGEFPMTRSFHVATYDEVRERFLVYGGRNDEAILGDLWELIDFQ